ncbi:MAG: DNA polymerase III, subunit gamma and tau [Candidatus Schekmanbacteria bacterium RBG_16_38_11]|uniref:DNA polymerase III subunit gamma/tau n=1 Tax=Candidatus Schekmanbacteria bacterium RBG_16_38_11 TaxID=1817880 RepID=A0A1F7S0E6_9BACT|nr:MAG: DNA polymerase III, subunit gamma and tau [Candidatus Schekmanbacteria bacterium RBG_16_38_11]
MATDYQVLARKKRPQVFEAIVGQDHITKTLKNAITSGRIAHAFLFTGIRGIGKTTCARVLAKALNCRKGPAPAPCNECDNCVEITRGSSLDVIEIDGASNRGINEVRELRENVKFAPAAGKYKIFIIDEVHMLTKEAFNALLKTIEEPPPHVIFILATTEPHKLPLTILSRCQRYDFRTMPREGIFKFLKKTAQEEGIKIDDKALSLIAGAADGSLRDSLSILESIVSATEGKISYEHVADILGVVDSTLLLSFSESLINKDSDRILSLIDELYSYGYDIKQFSKYFLNHLRDLIVISISKEKNLGAMVFHVDRDRLKEQAEKISYENLLQYFSVFYEAEKEIRRADNPRLLLEVTFLKMMRMESVIPLDKILKQIENLKGNLPKNSPALSEPLKNPGSPGTENPKTEEEQAPYSLKQNEGGIFPWEEFIKRVEEESISLGAFLRNGCIKEIVGNKITLAFEDSFSIQTISKDKNLKLLKSAAAALLGGKGELIVKKELSAKKTSEADEGAEKEKKNGENLFQKAYKEQAVKEVLEIFPGKIVDVKVLK